MVDTNGRGLVLEPQPADVQDRDGAPMILRLSRRSFPFIAKAFADMGFAGDGPANATSAPREGRGLQKGTRDGVPPGNAAGHGHSARSAAAALSRRAGARGNCIWRREFIDTLATVGRRCSHWLRAMAIGFRLAGSPRGRVSRDRVRILPGRAPAWEQGGGSAGRAV